MSDPRVPNGSRSVNELWAQHVDHVIDLRDGRDYYDLVFLVDLDAGLLGVYLRDGAGQLRMDAAATAEIPHPHMAHEFIRGDFRIVWKDDAPDILGGRASDLERSGP